MLDNQLEFCLGKKPLIIKVKPGLHAPICVAMALLGAWTEHEQNKSALRGMLHTPIYLAMTIAAKIGDSIRCV